MVPSNTSNPPFPPIVSSSYDPLSPGDGLSQARQPHPESSQDGAFTQKESIDSSVASTIRITRRRSQASSRASSTSDLELEEMGRDDPLYNGNGLHHDKLDTPGRTSWTDTLINRNIDQSGTSANRQARREGTRQFIEKTLINAVLIALW